MAYHRGGHAGAVAVSYSTNAMPTPLSPSRRYSSGSTGTATSGVGSSSSTKLSSYRSSTSSSFDRPSYFNSGSTSSSGYSSAHRSSYSSEYRRYCSPARSLSVSSSSYSETGTGSSSSGISPSNNTTSIGTSRYGKSGSRDRSETRETLGSLATSAADLYAKYSPANYVPNISASIERNQSANSIGTTNNATKGFSSSTINGYGNNSASSTPNNISTSSSNAAIFGGNSTNAKISSLRDNANELLLSTANLVQGRPPRAGRRSPVNTVINNHAQQPESAANVEVNYVDDEDVADDLKGDINNDNDNDNDNNNNNNNKKINENNNENEIEDGEDKSDRKSHFENLNGNKNEILLSNCRVGGNLNYTDSSYNGSRSNVGDCKSLIKKLESSDTGCSTTATLNSSIADGKGLIIEVNSLTCVSTAINKSNNRLLTNIDITKRNKVNKNEDNRIEETEGDGQEDDHTAEGASGTFLQSDRINPVHFYQSSLTCSLVDEGVSLDIDNNREEVQGVAAPSPAPGSSLVYLNSGDANTVVRKNVASRPTGNHAGHNNPSSSSSSSLPSTSRRGDNYTGNGTSSNGSNGIGNTTSQLAGTTQQNIYRGINDQIEGSPTIRAPRNRLQTPRDERCGLNGLRNIGNTCFMNSVIQCLSNTRPLLEYLVNEQYLADINTATSSMKGALIKAFSQVIQELWEVGGDHVVNTASLKSQIQRFAPRFMGYSQQDAQEFLRYLLEGLHEDVNRVTVKPQPIHTDIPEHYTDSQKAAESWKRYLRNEDSTIVDVFVGQLRSSLHCTSCGHVSVTLDPFWDLSLPIPTRSGTVKLNQCLEHFTKEEVLDGDEKPTCSKCQMRRKCTKSFSIQKFPKILVIHLKRFSPMERFRGKLNTLVDFPLTGLDLGAFSAPRVAGCTYNLYGVANHSGTTYSGHYTAYCKHPYSGEWHEYNDSRVSSIAARSVVSSEGYVLFYEQQPHSSNL